MSQWNKGDKFLYKSKYGGFVIGEVEDVVVSTHVNLHLHLNLEEIRLKSTNKVYYDAQEVTKITSFRDKDSDEKLIEVYQHLKEKKELHREEAIKLAKLHYALKDVDMSALNTTPNKNA